MNKYLPIGFLAAWALINTLPLSAVEQGDPMPNCALPSLQGQNTFRLEQYKGQVLYVDFWASWCGPCAQSFPFLNSLHNEFKDQGLSILGVNVDEEKSLAHEFLAKYPAAFPILNDAEGQCATNFAVKGMPSSYLIDRQGIVHHVHLGFRPSEAEEIRALVRQLLAAKK